MEEDEEEQERIFRDHLAALWAERRPRLLARVERLGALTGGSPGSADLEEARMIAHQLVGLLGTIGLPAGSEVARRVEQRLVAGETGVGGEIDELRALIESFDAG